MAELSVTGYSPIVSGEPPLNVCLTLSIEEDHEVLSEMLCLSEQIENAAHECPAGTDYSGSMLERAH